MEVLVYSSVPIPEDAVFEFDQVDQEGLSVVTEGFSSVSKRQQQAEFRSGTKRDRLMARIQVSNIDSNTNSNTHGPHLGELSASSLPRHSPPIPGSVHVHDPL